MIIFTLRLLAPHEKRENILKTVRSLLGPTQVEPGCISCRFYQEVDNSNALVLAEEWASKADLDRYIRSEEYRKILALIDISTEAPEITFNTISSTAGMEAIRAARGLSTNY